jgi:hypothetical protein
MQTFLAASRVDSFMNVSRRKCCANGERAVQDARQARASTNPRQREIAGGATTKAESAVFERRK